MCPKTQIDQNEREAKPKRKANHLARFTALLFLLMAISGFLRFYGALKQSAVLLEFGLTEAKLLYLVLAGLLYGQLNLTAMIFVLSRHRVCLIIAWIAAGLSIALYWVERFLLWAPELRGGNIIFMLVLHLLLIAVLLLFWRSECRSA